MAKPIVDMFSWNAPGNTLQDLYNWYLEGGDEDAGGGTVGTGGITNVYTGGGGGGGGNLQYNEMPVLSAEDYGIDNVAINNPYYMPNDPLDPMRLRGMEPEEYSLAGAIVGDRGLKTIRKSDDDEEVVPGMEWLTGKYDALPGYVKQYALPTAIGAMNPIMGGALALNKFMRPDATESAVGIAGLYASEANLLEDLLQAGLLVDAGNQGMKTITGKNVVSLMGGYEEGQQEIYDKLISQGYSMNANGEVVDEDGNVIGGRTKKGKIHGNFKAKQFLEAHFNRDRTETMTANTIKNMRKQMDDPTYIPRHHSVDIAKDAPDITPKTVVDTAASEDAYTPSSTPHPGLYTPIHSADPPSSSGSGGHTTPGGSGYGPHSGGSYGPHRAKGGLIRKKYGNGGIVDLL